MGAGLRGTRGGAHQPGVHLHLLSLTGWKADWSRSRGWVGESPSPGCTAFLSPRRPDTTQHTGDPADRLLPLTPGGGREGRREHGRRAGVLGRSQGGPAAPRGAQRWWVVGSGCPPVWLDRVFEKERHIFLFSQSKTSCFLIITRWGKEALFLSCPPCPPSLLL